jgi:hypothetical protein
MSYLIPNGPPLAGDIQVSAGQVNGELVLKDNLIVNGTTKTLGETASYDVSVGFRNLVAVSTVGAATLTVPQVFCSLITRTASGSGVSDTLPSADAIILAFPDLDVVVGNCVDFTYYNNTGFTMTIVAGANMSIVGTATVTNGSIANFKMVVTDADTPTMITYRV